MGICSACLDDEGRLPFCCPGKTCDYTLCGNCVKMALEDEAGANCRQCPMCKHPTARIMVETLCGKGAIREVERELRPQVEYEVQKLNAKVDENKKKMRGLDEHANILFNQLAEQLNLSCPRCMMVFNDYDNCNALTCGNPSCEARFCGICLKDCGLNAHECARSHGNLFDKALFEKSKRDRESRILEEFLKGIKDEPYEVHEIIKGKVESILKSSASSRVQKRDISSFVREAKSSLAIALKSERLSVAPKFIRGTRLDVDIVSPRNAIPTDFKLSLHSTGFSSMGCNIRFEELTGECWVWRELPEDADVTVSAQRPLVDALVNVKKSLECGVIAFEGASCLYQSRKAAGKGTVSRDKEGCDIYITLQEIDNEGATVGTLKTLEAALGRDVGFVVGVNQNKRLLEIEQHVNMTDVDTLIFPALRDYVGGSHSRRLCTTLKTLAPDSIESLNEMQRSVAHPLNLRTSMEVAGPPGSGKTKTITEMVRGIIQCTDYNVIVLSERNGAIDAIAEKLAGDCLDLKIQAEKKKYVRVRDLPFWEKILTFGSPGVGESTKMFLLSEKILYHPEIIACSQRVSEKERLVKRLRISMINRIIVGLFQELKKSLPNVFLVDQQEKMAKRFHTALRSLQI